MHSLWFIIIFLMKTYIILLILNFYIEPFIKKTKKTDDMVNLRFNTNK